MMQIIMAEVLELNSANFDMYKMKLVKYYVPWCQHCQEFKEQYETLQDLVDIPIAQVDCDSQKELCSEEHINGYPTIKLYYNGSILTYDGDREANLIKDWVNEMQLPVLHYSDVVPSGIYFEYKTNNIARDQGLFEDLKGRASIYVTHGDQELIAHLNQYDIVFEGPFTSKSINTFVLRYRFGLFPEFTQSSYFDLIRMPLAIFIHERGENMKDLEILAQNFNRSYFAYSHMDVNAFPEFVELLQCYNLPCVAVLDNGHRYSSEIIDFEEFLPFIDAVQNGKVTPLNSGYQKRGYFGKKMMNTLNVIASWLLGKDMVYQAFFFAVIVIILGVITVLPVILFFLKCKWANEDKKLAQSRQQKKQKEQEASAEGKKVICDGELCKIIDSPVNVTQEVK